MEGGNDLPIFIQDERRSSTLENCYIEETLNLPNMISSLLFECDTHR